MSTAKNPLLPHGGYQWPVLSAQCPVSQLSTNHCPLATNHSPRLSRLDFITSLADYSV